MQKLTGSFLQGLLMTVALMLTTFEKGMSATPRTDEDAKLKAVTAEVIKAKKNKDALLLVTFGSTWESPQITFNNMKERFAQAFPDRDVFMAFTSAICIKRCAAKGWIYYDPSFYLRVIANAGYQSVAVQSLHIIPGEEYASIESDLQAIHQSENKTYKALKIYLGVPLLVDDADIDEVAAILHRKMQAQTDAGNIVTFMGHGNPRKADYSHANSRYTKMETALQKFNKNYYVGTVDMEGNSVEDMIARMKKAGHTNGNVICHAFMSIVGDHANNDMKGGMDEKNPEEGSWRYALSKAGYNCPLSNCILMGLADYPEIVDVWIAHTRKALAAPSMFEK